MFAIEATNITLDNTAVLIPTPAAGQTVFYVKADGFVYYKTAAGVERLVNVTAAVAAVPGIGDGQTWQAPSRALGTTYTNSSGKPIMVKTSHNTNNAITTVTSIVGGVTIENIGIDNGSMRMATSFIVPNGVTYSVSQSGGSLSLWLELR